MPKTEKQLQREIERYHRNLRNAGLATEAELRSVAKSFEERSSVDDLWEYKAELRSLARERKALERKRRAFDDPEIYDVVLEVLEDRPEVVHLPSLNRTFRVAPASWARACLVEDIEYWLVKLFAARALFLKDQDDEEGHAEIADTLAKIQREIDHQRGLLYAQIVADTPSPADEPVDWANDIIPEEELLLKEAWHRVNLDRMNELPDPVSRDRTRKLPSHFAWIFQGEAYRNKRLPRHVIEDWSLLSIMGMGVMESIRNSEFESSADPEQVFGALT